MAKKKVVRKGWRDYYAAQKATTRPPVILKKAIRHVGKRTLPQTAIDLGCGIGNETHYLLLKGFSVVALDAQKEAIKHLRSRIPAKLKSSLTSRVSRFEDLRQRDLPELSLINASFSIFFCRPAAFQKFWKKLTRRLQPGGIFCGQFLGRRDDWSKNKGMSSVTKRTLSELFRDFEIVELAEHEDDSGTLVNGAKHWHYYSVIAKKKN